MYLKHLSILNYKNIEECDLNLCSKINLLWGKNGMGKTNILDTIYYMSFWKSHLGTPDNMVINHNANFFQLFGEYLNNDDLFKVHCSVERNKKKLFKYNDKVYKRRSDYIGKIPLVILSPADYELIRDGSDARRSFMDMIISQYDRTYMTSLIHYNKALKQRNSLLKQEGFVDSTILNIYDEQLCTHAYYIKEMRQKFTMDFLPVFQKYYQKISGGKEHMQIEYITQLHNDDLKDMLKRELKRDMNMGFTSVGIHKDDLTILMDGYQLKKFGSQGQCKSYLAALKMAQSIFIKENSGKEPIILLDDIFDKLDSIRVKNIIDEISKDDFGQIFISDTNREHIDQIIKNCGDTHTIFEIENGKTATY